MNDPLIPDGLSTGFEIRLGMSLQKRSLPWLVVHYFLKNVFKELEDYMAEKTNLYSKFCRLS